MSPRWSNHPPTPRPASESPTTTCPPWRTGTRCAAGEGVQVAGPGRVAGGSLRRDEGRPRVARHGALPRDRDRAGELRPRLLRTRRRPKAFQGLPYVPGTGNEGMRHVPPQTADVRMVDVGEVRLRTSVRGSGPPLLLITGLGACLELVAPFERRLSVRKLQVISFDAPGIGGSTPYPRPRRLPAHVRTITGLLDALGHDQVDVLGVSLGGAVAQQLARQAPDRVRRLVLAATLPGLGGVPGSPRAMLSLVMPRRYRDPAYHSQNAGRLYGGTDPAGPGCGTPRNGGTVPAAVGHRATRGSSSPSAAGAACRGCTPCGSPHWSWLGTTTRSSRWSTHG